MVHTQSSLSKGLQKQLASINGPTVVVAAVLTVTDANLLSYGDFNLSVVNGQIATGEPVLLPRTRGLLAARNLDGWVEKRKDLSKELREVSNWAPDRNGNGHHLVSRTIEAWPLQYHRARLNTISATVLEHLRDGALVRFRVDQPLSRESETFAVDLKFNMRFLKEAVGAANVHDADMTDEEAAKVQTVDWEMLPQARGIASLLSWPRAVAFPLNACAWRANAFEPSTASAMMVSSWGQDAFRTISAQNLANVSSRWKTLNTGVLSTCSRKIGKSSASSGGLNQSVDAIHKSIGSRTCPDGSR